MNVAHPKTMLRLLCVILSGLPFLPHTFASMMNFQIPQADANVTLTLFARQSGISLLYSKQEVAGVTTNVIQGKFDPVEALERMLENTALRFDQDVETGAIAVVVNSKNGKRLSPESSSGNSTAPNHSNPTQHTDMKKNKDRSFLGKFLHGLLGIIVATASTQAVSQEYSEDEEIYELSPFEVSTAQVQGYNAETTLAGNRLNTELRDVGSAVSVITSEFLKDVGATDNASLLQYTTGTEVGGFMGNFAGTGDAASLNEDTISPNQNTRVRGLAAADNTREFFRTDIPWDAYNVERVDLQRGPNSILFGQGSPSGIINTGLKGAYFNNSGQVELRIGSYGSMRGTLDLNREILKGELAVRLNALYDDEKYQQKPAYSQDERIYMALRYEPAFLNRNGHRTIIKFNVESGSVSSNNPRFLPPADAITPWFTELNQATYNQFQAWDHLSGRPNHGQLRVNLAADGSRNPAYEPHLGNFGFPAARAGTYVFNADGGQSMWVTNINGPFVSGGLGADGMIDGGIAAYPDNAWVSLVGTSQWAINAGADYASAGLWKNNLLTDPSIFDFYNKLIDGHTKREWQDFRVANINLTQTFFYDRLGVSLDYNRERYENGQKAMLPGEVRLQIDPMAVYGDGTPHVGLQAGVEPYSDGSPNPNVGRPFVSTNNAWSNRSYESERETRRLTVFATHDFSDGSDSWLRKLLGSHTLTGLFGEELLESDSRSWQRYGVFDDAYYALHGLPNERFNGQLTPTQIVYLGDSLLGRGLSGANIPSISGYPVIQNGLVQYFDSTWTANDVDPGALWYNGFEIPGSASSVSTQSENPSNYAGWNTYRLNFVDAEMSSDARDRLTTRATLNKAETSSQAFVWQAKWLGNALVSTYGWRKDVAKSWAFDMSPNDFDPTHDRARVDLSPSYYRLPSSGARVEVESRSYSVVAHLMDFPFLQDVTRNMPVELSLYYNKSTNFKPDSSRVDIYGEQHPAPSGKTIDRGVRIETRDGRYTLRINKYKTSNKSATSTEINAAAIGNWMQLTQNYANVFGYNILPWGYDATDPSLRGGDADVVDDASGIWQPMRYNFHLFNDGRTFSDQAVVSPDGAWVVDPALENAVIHAVREFQRAVDPRFWQAWRIDTFGDFGPPVGEATYSVPTGFALTEDNVSEGWEIELSAEPLTGWRITANASKTDARRTHVGNANIREFMNLVQNSLRIAEGDGVGRLQHYWGTEDVVTAGKNWFDGEGLVGAPGSEWRLAQLVENTTVPEMREWRINVVTNYDFSDGYLKGMNIGGGMRYQSSVIIAYPPTGDPSDPTKVQYDLTEPVKGPSETNFDFWVGYRKQLTQRIHWRIQVNVYNAFSGDNDLIPITAQPNGTFAAYRIAPKRSWSISNTFEF